MAPFWNIANPNEELGNKLLSAAYWGSVEKLSEALGEGAVVGIVNFQRCPDGETALHRAASMGHVNVIDVLLKCPDIDVNLLDGNGKTAFRRACPTGNVEIVQRLLGREDLNVLLLDCDDRTPLHGAAVSGAHEVLSVLLRRTKIDVNAEDIWRQTALHNACHTSRQVVVLLLRATKIGTNIVNKFGQLAIHQIANVNLGMLSAFVSYYLLVLKRNTKPKTASNINTHHGAAEETQRTVSTRRRNGRGGCRGRRGVWLRRPKQVWCGWLSVG